MDVAEKDLRRVLELVLPVWDKLSPVEHEHLIRSTTPHHFAAGSHIHGGGDDCIGVLLVARGQLRTYFLSNEGRESTLFRPHYGSSCLLSASCVLPSITFDVFIDAQTDVDLLIIAPACFNKLMQENPFVEAFAYRQIAERFSEVMWVMQQVLFVSFDKRLAAYLVNEAATQHRPLIAITHDTIARDLGSAREVVSRMLKYFEREGWVALGRGTITLTDPQQLKALAQ